MAMNWFHRWLCDSRLWGAMVEHNLVPWVVGGVQLGDRGLEIGPGYGANLRLLLKLVPDLTAVELNAELAGLLHRRYGNVATVVRGDATALPLPDGGFDSVLCFTMLHHVPSDAAQDALFAEAYRVLRPGGVLVGCDGTRCPSFDLIHLGDPGYHPVDPATLKHRLVRVGFTTVQVSTSLTWRRRPRPLGRWQRFRAYKA